MKNSFQNAAILTAGIGLGLTGLSSLIPESAFSSPHSNPDSNQQDPSPSIIQAQTCLQNGSREEALGILKNSIQNAFKETKKAGMPLPFNPEMIQSITLQTGKEDSGACFYSFAMTTNTGIKSTSVPFRLEFEGNSHDFKPLTALELKMLQPKR